MRGGRARAGAAWAHRTAGRLTPARPREADWRSRSPPAPQSSLSRKGLLSAPRGAAVRVACPRAAFAQTAHSIAGAGGRLGAGANPGWRRKKPEPSPGRPSRTMTEQDGVSTVTGAAVRPTTLPRASARGRDLLRAAEPAEAALARRGARRARWSGLGAVPVLPVGGSRVPRLLGRRAGGAAPTRRFPAREVLIHHL